MSDIENYYYNIIEKIESLVTNSEIDKAIFILEDELNAPYIPIHFQDVLESKLTELIANKKYFSKVVKYESVDRDNLLKLIIEKNTLNIFAMETFFNRYGKNLSKSEILFFEQILISKDVKNYEKILIIEALSYLEIKGILKFFNVDFDKVYEIDLSNVKPIISLQSYKEIMEVIDDLTLKEPSVFEMSKNLLLSIFYYYFPLVPNFDSKFLAKGIFDYILFSLQGTQLPDNEINQVILKIAKNII